MKKFSEFTISFALFIHSASVTKKDVGKGSRNLLHSIEMGRDKPGGKKCLGLDDIFLVF